MVLTYVLIACLSLAGGSHFCIDRLFISRWWFSSWWIYRFIKEHSGYSVACQICRRPAIIVSLGPSHATHLDKCQLGQGTWFLPTLTACSRSSIPTSSRRGISPPYKYKGGRRSPAVACWASDHWVASSNPLRIKFRH